MDLVIKSIRSNHFSNKELLKFIFYEIWFHTWITYRIKLGTRVSIDSNFQSDIYILWLCVTMKNFMKGLIDLIIKFWDIIFLIKPRVQLYFYSGIKYFN